MSPPAIASMASSASSMSRVTVPRAAVEVDEHDQRRPHRSFVAVGKGMVPGEPTDENAGPCFDRSDEPSNVEQLVGPSGSFMGCKSRAAAWPPSSWLTSSDTRE